MAYLDSEKAAYESFIEYFTKNHKNVYFPTCFLESLMNDFNVEIFGLFLYNRDSNNVFSKNFSNFVTQKVVNNLNLLAWDVSDDTINEGLQKTLKDNLNYQKLKVSVFMKESAFYIFRVNESIPLKVYNKGNFDENKFVAEICQIYGVDEGIFSKTDYGGNKLADFKSFGIEYELDLRLAIERSFREKTPLLLYVHKRNDYFSQTFWEILSKTDANNLIKKFIFFPVDTVALIKSLCQEYEFLSSLSLQILNQGSVILVVKKLKNVTTDFLKGNVTQQELLTNLFNIYMKYEEDKVKILYEIETKSIQTTIRNFKDTFGKNSLPIEKVSLNNALETCVFVQPNYLRKILIICLYDESESCIYQFSQIFKNKKVQDIICSMYHILLWDIQDDNLHKSLNNLNETYFKNEDLLEKIKNKKTGLFFVQANDDKAEIIESWNMNANSLQYVEALVTIYSKELVEQHSATDLSEVEAANKFLSLGLVSYKHRFVFETLPLQRLITKQCTRKNVSKRKMLLLHLQNGKTKSEFLDTLPTIYEDLKKYFCVVAWDISDINLTSELLLASERYFRSDEIKDALKNQKSESFIFIPTTDTLAFAGKLINLKFAIDIVNKEKFNFGFTKSPFMFQQNMCEQLGDRDYNHFNLEKEEQEKFFHDWIGYAIFGPPTEKEGKYKEARIEHIKEVASQIQTQVKKYSFNPKKIYVACIYISTIPKGEELENHICLPVIAVQKCVNSPGRSCRFFIDSNLRVYSTWKNYLSENNLSAGTFIVPQDGSYQIDCFGKVRLECIFDEKLLANVVNFMDKASIYTGLGSAAVGAATILTAIPVAPLVVTGAAAAGVATGVYSLFRGAANLYDRNNHEESMQFNNRQARAAYLNLAAGVFAFGTAGATGALSYFARNGAEIGEISMSFINAVCGVNIAVAGISLGNAFHDVYYCWRYENNPPDALMILQLTSSALFFGNSVYNVQSASTIISEAQAQKLADFSKNLSRKQRRMLNKMTKETARQHKGDTLQANREVISYLNNVDNVQEVLATLGRYNKRFNQKNIKFDVNNNEVRLNGVVVNLKTFNSLSNLQKANFFKELPPIPRANLKQRTVVTYSVNKYFNPSNLMNASAHMVNIYKALSSNDGPTNISAFSELVVDRLLYILRTFLEEASLDSSLDRSLISLVDDAAMKIIIDFFMLMANASNLTPYKDYLDSYLKKIEAVIMIASLDIDVIIRKLLKFAVTWLAQNAFSCNLEKDPEETDYRNNRGVVCEDCKGRHI